MTIEKFEKMAETAIFFTLGVMLPIAFPTALLMSSYQIELLTGIKFWFAVSFIMSGLITILVRKDLIERLQQKELFQVFLLWFYGMFWLGWLLLGIGYILEKAYDWLAGRIARDLKDSDSKPN